MALQGCPANIADTMGRSCAMNPRIRLMSGFQGDHGGSGPDGKSQSGRQPVSPSGAGHGSQPGDIIVVSNDEDQTRSLMGEIMFTYAKYQRKLGGLVLDGPIRDVDAVRQDGSAGLCQRFYPWRPHKEGPGRSMCPLPAAGECESGRHHCG